MPRGIYKRIKHWKQTEEHLRKLILARTGKKRSQEAKDNISKGTKGIKKPPFTEEHRKKMGLKGSKHPNWNGGSSFFPYSPDWTETLKRSIRERDNYICKICGKCQSSLDKKQFPIHHIDYNKKNCNPDNLITLCKYCHTKTNHKRDYWINYFSK